MILLYIGPIITWLAYILIIQRYELSRTGTLLSRTKPLSLWSVVHAEWKSTAASYTTQLLLRSLVIAPITEEILFRSLLTPTLFATYPTSHFTAGGRLSILALVLGCPAFFAVAHLHHLYEKVRSGISVTPALIQVLIQATYTYIFGCICMLLFIRTGSVFACITSHVICNYMGLPDVSFMQPFSYRGQYSMMYPYRFILLLLHGLGLVLFGFALGPLTATFSDQSVYLYLLSR